MSSSSRWRVPPTGDLPSVPCPARRALIRSAISSAWPGGGSSPDGLWTTRPTLPPMTVRIEYDGPVTTVVIDRPEARNAVDGPTADRAGRRVPGVRRRPRPVGRRADRRRRHVLRGRGPQGDRYAVRQPGPSGRGRRGRPDGPHPDAAGQARDRRRRGSRRGGRARAGHLVRPARGRRGRDVRGLLPTLGRAPHRRRHGAAAPAHRHRAGPGPDPHRPGGRCGRGARHGAGRPGGAAGRGPRGGRGARPRAERAASGLPAQRPALGARAGRSERGRGAPGRARARHPVAERRRARGCRAVRVRGGPARGADDHHQSGQTTTRVPGRSPR